MGCIPLRLGLQGPGHYQGGRLVDADGPDLAIIDMQVRP